MALLSEWLARFKRVGNAPESNRILEERRRYHLACTSFYYLLLVCALGAKRGDHAAVKRASGRSCWISRLGWTRVRQLAACPEFEIRFDRHGHRLILDGCSTLIREIAGLTRDSGLDPVRDDARYQKLRGEAGLNR